MVHEDAGLVVYIGAKNRRRSLPGWQTGVVRVVCLAEEKPSVTYVDDIEASVRLELHHFPV